MSKPETQAVPSGINWQTRAGSALALVALLGVGVAGGVSSYLQQREQRLQAAAHTPDVTPIALKSGEPAAGGGSRTETKTKTETPPGKTEAGDKTPPSITPSKTDVPATKGPATKGNAKSDAGGKSPAETTKPSGIGKTADEPRASKESGPRLEKTANPAAEPSKSAGTDKTTDSKTTAAKEGASKVEKTAKPAAEPSKTSDTEKAKETRPSDGKKAPAAEPGKTSKSDDSSKPPSKASSPSAKEKSVGDVPPAAEPHKHTEPGKSAEPAKSGKAATPRDTAKAQAAGSAPGDEMQAATIVVQVPADAKVYFDGQATTQTGNQRSFVTPPLRRSAILYYELKAEFAPGGQVVSRTLRIAVRGGETTRVELTPANTRVISPAGR